MILNSSILEFPPVTPEVACAMKKLGTFFNPEAQAITDRVAQLQALENQSTVEPDQPAGRETDPDSAAVLIDRFHQDFGTREDIEPDYACLLMEAGPGPEMEKEVSKIKNFDTIPQSAWKDIFENPSNYDEAWNHPDPWQREKWREAILLEFKKMEDHKVWKKIPRTQMPKNRRCVKCKWIFEIKRSGIFRSRLVACGYSQVPGVDFTEFYSPVVNDVTIRILLVAEIVWKLVSRLIDVETAFLHGELAEGEEIYMECPDGMSREEWECLMLLKTIYGLVQAARAFFKRYLKVLKLCGFRQSPADPCLMVRRNKLGVVYMALHVDDCYGLGHPKAVENAIHMIKDHFNLTIEPNLMDYLSCEIRFDRLKEKAWLGQPHLIKNLDKKFGEMVKSGQTYRTPGTPGLGIIRPKEGDLTISEEDQTLYRSGVGMLLYLVKHSRPDIANSVRELSKSMSGATEAAFKELKRVIKFVLDTRTYGLKLQPKAVTEDEHWSMTVFTDSDWAGDKDNRISITGSIVFLLGAPILWKSKAQKSVSLSSTEAEYYALSEAAKEIKFVVQILLSMGIPVQLPVIVRVDNMGAIFMSENASASSRTKHVDTRYHFVREFVEDGFIRIVFVRTVDNVSDSFTKNVTGDIYEAHVKEFIADRTYLE